MKAIDPFDPRFFPSTRRVYRIYLSNRYDISCIVDYKDWLWARHYKWDFVPDKHKKKFYARRSDPNGPVYLHREICYRAYGPPPQDDMVSDHKNGDSLYNRRSNLRWFTRSEDRRNRR